MKKTPTYMTRELRANLACLSCNRVAAVARPGRVGMPTTFILTRAEDAEYVKRRRCPICLGSLWVGEREVVTTLHKLPDSEINPKPGRPRKTKVAS